MMSAPAAGRPSPARGRLLAALLLLSCRQALVAQSATRFSAAKVDKATVASLPTRHARTARIIAHVDLTRPFATRTQWTFVAASLPGSRRNAAGETVRNWGVAVCFVDGLTPRCGFPMPGKESRLYRFGAAVHLYVAKVVFAGANGRNPLLLVKTFGAYGGDGGHAIYTQVFAYDGLRNRFKLIFSNGTGSNNNQETRFVRSGPLRGDIIVARPTQSAPFAYWISVYTWNAQHPYSHRTLRFRSATRYGDGNSLAVIDSEMPDILERFGKWKPGDPLPAPQYLPRWCGRPFFIRRGEEWCTQDRQPSQ